MMRGEASEETTLNEIGANESLHVEDDITTMGDASPGGEIDISRKYEVSNGSSYSITIGRN